MKISQKQLKDITNYLSTNEPTDPEKCFCYGYLVGELHTMELSGIEEMPMNLPTLIYLIELNIPEVLALNIPEGFYKIV